MKCFPKSMRDMLRIRRTCRKKIQERITAVTGIVFEQDNSNSNFSFSVLNFLLDLVSHPWYISAMITALEEFNSHQKCGPELAKASMKLSKALGVADIRVIINMAERTGDEVYASSILFTVIPCFEKMLFSFIDIFNYTLDEGMIKGKKVMISYY